MLVLYFIVTTQQFGNPFLLKSGVSPLIEKELKGYYGLIQSQNDFRTDSCVIFSLHGPLQLVLPRRLIMLNSLGLMLDW